MRRTSLSPVLLLGTLALLAACSSSDDDGSGPALPTATRPATSVPTIPATATFAATIPATSTATRAGATATPTEPPAATATGSSQTATPATGAAVSGLVVVRGDVRAGSGDALAAPPAEWSAEPDGGTFDRALSHAAWRVTGAVERQGTTAADGRFSIGDLPPGSYRLHLERTLNGDLIHAIVPFDVGDDGTAEVVVEIAQGLVRTTNVYRDGEVEVRAVTGPSGNRVVTRDDTVTELGGSGRSYEDADGDGVFDPTGCNGAPRPWTCAADGDCGDDHVCSCASSCPFCDDCFIGVCLPKGSFAQAYSCSENRACLDPSDNCVCVGSCPDCEDCPASVCVSSCLPAEIASISVSGPERVYLGRQAAVTAVAFLTDGGAIDVTHLVAWESSDEAVLAVDSWGTLTGHGIGSAQVSATLGELSSEPWTIQVVDRPGLRRIHLQNLWCVVPFGEPNVGPGGAEPRPADGSIPAPTCRQVVRIGGTLQLFALGEFDDGYYEDITTQVTWTLSAPEVGQVDGGVFTGVAVGAAELTASLGEVVSNALELRVVDQPTVVALQIYPLAAVAREGPLPPISSDAPFPCYDCGFAVTLLRGDEMPFQAVASYDTGEWEDVTARVTWSTSNAGIAAISAAGVVTAVEGGEASISATLGEVSSNTVGLRVVNEATLLSLSIYQEGLDTVVEKGAEVPFKAIGYYDVGFGRDVTASVVWRSSDEAVGGFSEPGVFVGRAAGAAVISAELDEVQSNGVPIEVFESSSLSYCDDNAINRAEWSDAFNRVVLDSDCSLYEHPDVATLRFTVTERERPAGIFDPCLDLYVYQGDRLVRTIREEGCGRPFLAPGAPEFDDARLRYQTLAFWDLRDDRGSPVPPGSYTIRGVFYLYYDPIVELPVVVTAPDGRIPCTDNACGNGCGYVHACGDEGPPTGCPEVCTRLCECPAGWGITDEGDCEPCTEECCPQGAACLPGTPTCDPPPVCCPAGQACIPELPPCGARCCPLGALCGPLDLPPCDCCPDGAQCGTGIVPCGPPPPCCPRDAICILPLPPCPPGDCCPPGVTCAEDIVPCEERFCCKADGSCDPASPPCP